MEILSALLIITYLIHPAATQVSSCKVTISKPDFYSYILNYDTCQVSADLSQLQNEFPIVSQAFTLAGDFDKTAIDYDGLSDFCMDLASCKGSLTSCESDLNDFIRDAGSALCANGEAMSNAIVEAAEVLSKDACSGEAEATGLLPNGCYLSMDSVTMPTYLQTITRKNKIKSAESRCLSRYLEENKVCTAKSIKALNTLIAASNRVESIGTSFNSYTNYAKPTLSDERVTLSLVGFAHLYKEDERQATCNSLADSKVLLWNPYINIDGTLRTLEPTVPYYLLSDVYIQFSNAFGQVVDSYLASASAEKLTKMTQRQLGGLKSDVDLNVKGENVVVLYHSDSKIRVTVGKVEDTLSLVLTMPQSLYDSESAGVLVDGCEAYNGVVATDVTTVTNGGCISKCASAAANKDECAYDCENGIAGSNEIYTLLVTQISEAEAPIIDEQGGVGSSSTLTLSLITMFLSLLLVL